MRTKIIISPSGETCSASTGAGREGLGHAGDGIRTYTNEKTCDVEPDTADAVSEYEDGRMVERAKIVAWLRAGARRAEALWPLFESDSEAWRLADSIEAGKHLMD